MAPGLVPNAYLPWLGVAAGALVVLAATLAAAEAALGRLTRAEAAHMVTEGRRGAHAVQVLVDDPSQALSVSTLLRVTAESVAAVCVALVVASLTARWWVGLLVAAAVMGLVSFLLVGVSPRTVGRQHAERVALLAAPRLRLVTRLIGPLTRALVAVGNAITPGKGYRDGPFASEGQLRELVDRASESAIIEAEERKMIHSVFELGDTLVREVMSPRTDLVTIPADATLRQAMGTFLASGHSRIPVVGADTDDVVGVLYLKDVARALHGDRRADSRRAGALARPAVFLPESRLVDAALNDMRRDANHLAVVIDEYGGVAGVVTLEDLVEEIVGDIADEYDVEAPEVEQLEDGAYRVSSRLPIDELGELFGVQVDDDEVDSVGGLLVKALGTVPEQGAHVRVAGLELLADAVDGNRIATVVARRPSVEDGA